MDKIILKLLHENGRVIVPDFGALIVKQKSPFTVIFNEFLQYNDGALITAITEVQKIERDDAANKVKEFTKEIQDKLSKGEEVTLQEVGVLTKSSTGKISLKEIGATGKASPNKPPANKPSETTASVGKTVELEIEEEKKTTEPKKTAPATASPTKKETPRPTTPEAKKETPTPTSGKSEPANKDLAKKNLIVPPKKDLPGGMPSSTPKKDLPGKTPSTQTKKDLPGYNKPTPTNTTEKPPIAEYYSENGKKKKLNIILWIVLIVIVNGSIIIGFLFFRDEVNALFSGKKTATQLEDVIIQEDENVINETADTLLLTETDSTTEGNFSGNEGETVIETVPEQIEEEVQPQAQESFAGTKYYVVAGVFQDEANADRLVTKLQREGHNAEKFTKIGRMHAVCYDVFPTKREADRLMLKVNREQNAGAWIKIMD